MAALGSQKKLWLRMLSVELGADDDGGGAAVPFVKLEGQQQRQQQAHSHAGGDSGGGFSCWWRWWWGWHGVGHTANLAMVFENSKTVSGFDGPGWR